MASDLSLTEAEQQTLELDQTYRAQNPLLLVTVVVRQIIDNADFRGAAEGRVDGILAGMACAGWSGAFGAMGNSFTMLVKSDEEFSVKMVDDFNDTIGTNWEIQSYVRRIQ